MIQDIEDEYERCTRCGGDGYKTEWSQSEFKRIRVKCSKCDGRGSIFIGKVKPWF